MNNILYGILKYFDIQKIKRKGKRRQNINCFFPHSIFKKEKIQKKTKKKKIISIKN